MIVRKEKASDIEAITEAAKAVFRDHSISNQAEHIIVKALR